MPCYLLSKLKVSSSFVVPKDKIRLGVSRAVWKWSANLTLKDLTAVIIPSQNLSGIYCPSPRHLSRKEGERPPQKAYHMKSPLPFMYSVCVERERERSYWWDRQPCLEGRRGFLTASYKDIIWQAPIPRMTELHIPFISRFKKKHFSLLFSSLPLPSEYYISRLAAEDPLYQHRAHIRSGGGRGGCVICSG